MLVFVFHMDSNGLKDVPNELKKRKVVFHLEFPLKIIDGKISSFIL